MQPISKRFVSLLLVVVLGISMVVIAPFASAAFVYDPQPSFGTSIVDTLVKRASGKLGFDVDPAKFVNLFSETGPVSSLRRLISIEVEYNNQTLTGYLSRPFGDLDCIAEVDYDSDNGIYRLKDRRSGRWLYDSRGRFPYFECDIPDDTPAWALIPSKEYPSSPELAASSSNRWLELAPIQVKLNSGALSGNTTYSYEQLRDLLFVLRADNPSSNYRLAPVFGGSYGVCRNNLVLCDESGKPFIAFSKKESSVTNQYVNNIVQDKNGNAVIIQGDNVTTDKPIIDQSNFELNIPVTDNSSSVSIEDFIHQDIYNTSYNFDDHSYTVNTYDVTYNNDNRRYETNYYTWNITYNITNTYVTYIGSNDAYQQKEYEFYYELPDGRSSADLTADEVAAMSFQFADCMNYQRSATDTNLRALYHFDGDLSDSGYFSDKTSFVWKEGASITYVDSATFEGALYLDATAHSFDITLPSSIQTGADFTIQWRYYQASEVDTQSNINNSVALGSASLVRWDEQELFPNTSTSSCCALPVGNWVELALVRHSGVVYLYVNGLKVSSWTNNAALGKVLSFTFGTTSRAYSMLDELRVLDFALVTDGASYTPTAVPYDSNLVLVLPGEEKVVDEWWEFDSPNNLIPHPDFTAEGYPYPFSSSSRAEGFFGYNPGVSGGNSPESVSLDDGFLSLGATSASSSYVGYSGAQGFFYSLVFQSSINDWYYAPGVTASDGASTSTFTFSVVDTAGQVYSLVFPLGSTAKTASFSWGKLEYKYAKKSSGYGEVRAVLITPKAGQHIDIIYAELVKASSARVVATKVTSIFDLSTLKPNTAAVQTDIPIHGYTVGGVRPTFPVRGDVWFGVTNGRVSTVQVYTGSAWTSSNARWWTGERWIPIYAFDIFTLEDCWDIADSDDVITPIESDTAGWNWWKKAWTDFRSWLGGVFGDGTSVEPSPTPIPTPTPSPSPSGPVIDDRPLVLAPGVNIVRENTDTWTANNAASVTIAMEAGDLWNANNTARNLFTVDLMRGATSDDLFVSLDVDGLPPKEGNEWDNASFMLFAGDDTYVSLGKKSHVTGLSVTKEVFASGSEYAGSSNHNSVTSATLAFCKKGNTIRTFFRPLGNSWVEGETITVDVAFSKVGFACWQFHDRGRSVTFSNLRMSTASRFDLVTDMDTMLTSFVTNTPLVPFFLGGGFEVLPDRDPVSPESAPRPSADPLIDEDGKEVSIWDFPAKLFDGLWGLLSGLVGVVAGGVGGLFSFIGNGVGGFFGAFNGDGGVFDFATYEGVDIWD